MAARLSWRGTCRGGRHRAAVQLQQDAAAQAAGEAEVRVATVEPRAKRHQLRAERRVVVQGGTCVAVVEGQRVFQRVLHRVLPEGART
jgi:hypothetical protein